MPFLNARRLRWRLLVIEALIWLMLVLLVLRLLPFRLVIGRLEAGRGVEADRFAATPPMAEAEIALRIGRAVRLAGHRLPWTAFCLPQAMAAKAMLRCRGISARLHLGSGADMDGIRAHAWLTLGRLAITGGARRFSFSDLARFG